MGGKKGNTEIFFELCQFLAILYRFLSATVSRRSSTAAELKRDSIANAVSNHNSSSNLIGTPPVVPREHAPKQVVRDTKRQMSSRQVFTSRPMSQEEKLELAGRNAASAMSGDRTSRACSIL